MIINKEKLNNILLLLFIILVTQGNVIIQFISVIVFGITNLMLFGSKTKYSFRWFFYIGLIALSLFQLLFFWKNDYTVNYIINTLLSSTFLIFSFLCSEFIIQKVGTLNTQSIKKIIGVFFTVNVLLIVIQYIIMVIKSKNILPFASPMYNMSAGDNIKGFFSNSSINMIINSFYVIFFIHEKKKFLSFCSIIVVLLTTYMSGIFLFVGVIGLFVFFTFSLRNKIKSLAVFTFLFLLFYSVSPQNIDYAINILTNKINSKVEPARKFISFEQTLNSSIKNPKNFIFGVGGGKFSSRTAFVSGGEYVTWFPKQYSYRSKYFEENHFSLWNKKILSKKWTDGTANQPFSFYNKIIGEYGLLGIFLFSLYLYYPIKYFNKLRYGKMIFLSMLSYFILDYWFEYFSVIIFFELFIYLDIKSIENE